MPLNSSAEISGEFARLKNVIPADESERSALLRAFGMATNAVASNRALATALTMDALIDVMLSASDSALRRRAGNRLRYLLHATGSEQEFKDKAIAAHGAALSDPDSAMRKETIQYFHALAFSECTPEQAGKAMASLAKTLADEDPSIVAYGTDSLARWAIQKPAMREAVVEVFEIDEVEMLVLVEA